MHPDRAEKTKSRVISAAEAALAEKKFVSPIDVLVGSRMLERTHVEAWRKGRVGFLESVIQGNLKKISLAMATFRAWAREKGLKPSETKYVRIARGGQIDLRFSASGDHGLELNYRTHYVSPALPERKQQQIHEKLERAPNPVVFDNLRDSECSECGTEIAKGSFLFMEGAHALCLPCAGMDNLEYSPRGDTALTRRATKHSERTAVVVRFSRSRGRYERQGILVETSALEKAEQECSIDAAERAQMRKINATRRKEQDRVLIIQMTERINALFPHCPPEEAASIAAHTAERGSGRVGRTAAGRKLEEQALTAAMLAAVRHRHTDYDLLLEEGVDRDLARQQVAGRARIVLENWR